MQPQNMQPQNMQPPPGIAGSGSLTPKTFRLILAGVFLVGSMLPVLRGCNTSWNSFDIVAQLGAERMPENVIPWLLMGALLFIVSLIFIALYTFGKNENKRSLFNKIWAFALTGYIVVGGAFVADSKFFALGIGWYVLLLVAGVGHQTARFMKMAGVRDGALPSAAGVPPPTATGTQYPPQYPNQGSQPYYAAPPNMIPPPPSSVPPPPINPVPQAPPPPLTTQS